MAQRPPGVAGYDANIPTLVARFESVSFADVQGPVLHLVPPAPADVLDIGTGSGRDAAALAALGYRVVAVEPSAPLRAAAMARHASPNIDWVDDALPNLTVVLGRDQRFDVVMLTAVWMHLDADERSRGMANLAALLRPTGVLLMSLRHGPVPPGRHIFAVGAEETVALARAHGLRCVLNREAASILPGKDDVTWTRLAFVPE